MTQIAWPTVGRIGVVRLIVAVACVLIGALNLSPVPLDGNNAVVAVAQFVPVPD